MADELLDQLMSTTFPELSDDELLETPLLDLNNAKLPTMVMTSSATSPPAQADLMVSVTSINEFLKLMLDNILSLASVSKEMATPVNQTEMDTKPHAPADQTLTDIPEETTTDNETRIDMVQTAPAVNPSIYLARPRALPSPPMIARYAPPMFYPLPDLQWTAMVATFKAYNFLPQPPGMVCAVHHWRDYPQSLRDQIIEILMLAQATIATISQPRHMVPTALIATQ
uniref:Uncharacterized protein n=1 Tax=Romanomermis culicivorax TaxID=13658 RepID=A0A915IAC7_ROMCU